MTDQQKSATYLPHIDGLRAIAVLIILLFHIDVPWFRGGFVGVDVFFVISGYLITRIIARDIRDGRFSFWSFYARRMKRIFPALFAMLLLTSLATIVFLGPHQYYEFFKALRMTAGQISNFYFAREVDYFSPGNELSPLLHTWSLGVEEQFYLLWPLLLFAAHKFFEIRRLVVFIALLFVASLGISEYLVLTDAMSAFYHLHARAWELALGGLVALHAFSPLRRRIGIDIAGSIGLAMVLYAALFFEEAHFPGLKAVIPCAGAALFLHAAQQSQGIAHKILSHRLLTSVGLISYSLYLWHWPVVAYYKSYFSPELSPAVQVEMLILSFTLAYISWRWVEQPFRHMSIAPGKTVAAGFAMVAAFIIASNIIKNENDAGWRVTYDVAEHVRAPHALDKICSIEGGAYNTRDCIIGPNKDKYEVILVGDSHASHYTPTVLAWAKENGLTVRLFLRGACKAWVETNEIKMKNGKADDYCMGLTRDFYSLLENDAHIKYLFLGQYMPGATQDVRHSIEKIASYKRNTIFLGQVPIFRSDPHECQIRNNLLITKLFPRDHADCMALDLPFSDELIARSKETFLPLLQQYGIRYFDPTPYIKTPFDEKGRFMYLDSNHMNRYGANHLAPYLREFMAPEG